MRFSTRSLGKIPTAEQVLMKIKKKHDSTQKNLLLESLRNEITEKMDKTIDEHELTEFQWYKCACSEYLKADLFNTLEKEMSEKGFVLVREYLSTPSVSVKYISLRALTKTQCETISKERQKKYEAEALQAYKENKEMKTSFYAVITFYAIVTLTTIGIIKSQN